MTNFLGWELFSNGGSTVGTLGQCILQNFLNVVQSTVECTVQCTPMYVCQDLRFEENENLDTHEKI